jgi:hypothetical protein
MDTLIFVILFIVLTVLGLAILHHAGF